MHSHHLTWYTLYLVNLISILICLPSNTLTLIVAHRRAAFNDMNDKLRLHPCLAFLTSLKFSTSLNAFSSFTTKRQSVNVTAGNDSWRSNDPRTKYPMSIVRRSLTIHATKYSAKSTKRLGFHFSDMPTISSQNLAP